MADRHTIYKNGAKEIAGAQRPGAHVHGEVRRWTSAARRATSTRACGTPTATTPLMCDADGPEHMSAVFRGWLGGLLAHGRELAWLFAPTVNSYKRYQPESWAPTAVAWGRDNRTCGFRVVGHGPGFRVECRDPRRRLQPVPRVRGDDRRRALRHRARRSSRGAGFDGNAYEADDVGPRPVEHRRRDRRVRAERDGDAAFGADVHCHLLNTAKQEWAAFNRVVTDWERRRNFEQL